MHSLTQLKPWKREDAFSVQAASSNRDKVGIQSINSKKVCVSVWDPVKKRYENRIDEKNEFDILG